jgi:nitroreductase
MEVLEAIKTRRSIGKYKTTPVDEKTIELVLDVAPWVTLRQNLRLSQGWIPLK